MARRAPGVGLEGESEPLELLRCWLAEAAALGVPASTTMALTTVSAAGQPSTRIVDLKRLEDNALVFTTSLWTRKAREIVANPRVSALFHWPTIGRQVQIAATAVAAERELAEELFAARAPAHRLQTIVSRQGEPIRDLAPLRARLAEARRLYEKDAVPCPPDWGAMRLIPHAIELWQQAEDRLHDRLLFEQTDAGWRPSRLSP